MNTNPLPTDDLKKFGIIEADNSFSKRLNANDIIEFMQGNILVADNEKDRITFQLTDNNSKLEVKVYQMEHSLSEILDQSKKESVQYVSEKNLNGQNPDFNISKKAFLYNESTKSLEEYDMVFNAEVLTKTILGRNDSEEINRYKDELLKLKEFLQDKIDKYPEIAKDIINNLNILSKEINTVNEVAQSPKQAQKQQQSEVRLDVNDPDLYQDANSVREAKSQQEDEENEQEIEQEQEKRRGFRR
ncbi:hypothetical protein CO230_07475 [Chryseobacterium sp. 6424]|uniref:hypothetical protein n=1 Tax=Chryseobacterium sp. 6424 TaxID=2039166 RepID=UPI000EFD911B|nr:hypothetical protein [Chryseobacterium sp. 6424]AYO57976.1 hypothetical protein CO230_07475 [Chryseobacterium sp. 6424]